MNLQELENQLDQLIFKNNIMLTYQQLETSDPDIAVIDAQNNRAIIVNTNYEQPISVIFRKAHEFGHHLTTDFAGAQLYHFSSSLQNEYEVTANIAGIEILAKILFKDVPKEYRNWKDFIDNLNLPSHFEIPVKRIIYDF